MQLIIERILTREKLAVQRARHLKTVVQGTHIAAGAKRLLAGTLQQHAANGGVGGETLKLGLQFLDHSEREGIERGGTI
jgi:hypothetical protein